MTNPFTAPSISGYNTSPPADDGSQVSTNQVKWATHKTKLSDPIKTYVDDLVTNTNTAFATVDDASNLTTGELPDARLSSNVPLLDAANTFTTNQTISAAAPAYVLREHDQPTDEKIWRTQISGGNWLLQTLNDAESASATAINIDRTGTNIDSIALTADAFTWGGSTVLTEADEGSGNGIDADTVDGIEAAALRDATINTQNGNYTLVIGDAGKTIYKASGGGGETVTIPANGSVAFPTGTMVTFVNQGGGNLSIAITSDTLTLAGSGSTGTRTLADDGAATAIKVTSTSWIISGSGLT